MQICTKSRQIAPFCAKNCVLFAYLGLQNRGSDAYIAKRMSDLDDLTARAYAAFPRRREPATVRSYERPRDPQGPAVCRAAQHQRRAGGLPHPPRASRVWRWSTAAGDAEAALNELRELQEEYQDWHNNLPEFAQDTCACPKA